MTKKLYSIVLYTAICLFTSLDVLGQITPIEIFQYGNNVRVRDRTGTISIPYEPYLYTEFKFMEVELLDGTQKEGMYKYNLETESLEKTGSSEVINASQIKGFRINNVEGQQYFVNIKVIWPKNEYLGFFEQIDDGFNTVVKHYLQFKPADYNANMDMGNPYDRVEKEIEIYLRVLNKWYLAPDNKKQLIEIMSEFMAQDQVKKYIKKNKIKPNNPQDLAKLVDYVTKN